MLKIKLSNVGLFLFFCCFCASGQQNPEEKLHGKIASLSTVVFESKYVSIEKNILQKYSKEKLIYRKDIFYDSAQNIIREADFKPNNAEKSGFAYVYDTNGRMVVKKETAGASRQVIETTEYTYNQQGALKKSIVYNATKELTRSSNCTYNEKEQLIREQTFNSIHILIKDMYYEYDSTGNQTKIESRKSYSVVNMPYRIEQEFDTRGRLTAKRHFDENNVLTSVNKVWYDVFHNRINSETETDKEGKTITQTEFTYDKKGRLSIQTTYNPAQPALRKVELAFRYNKNGKLHTITTFLYDNPNPSSVKTYYYDGQGNWISWIEKIQSGTYVCERKIKYL